MASSAAQSSDGPRPDIPREATAPHLARYVADAAFRHRLPLGDVVVDLGRALVEEAGERLPAPAAISERLGHRRFGRQAAKGIVDRDAQVLDLWTAALLPASLPDIWRRASYLVL